MKKMKMRVSVVFVLIVGLFLVTMPVSAQELVRAGAHQDDQEELRLPVHQDVTIHGHHLKLHFGNGQKLIILGDNGDSFRATRVQSEDGTMALEVQHGHHHINLSIDSQSRSVTNGDAVAHEFQQFLTGHTADTAGGFRIAFDAVESAATHPNTMVIVPDGLFSCGLAVIGFILAFAALCALTVASGGLDIFLAVAGFELAAAGLVDACHDVF